MAEKSTNPNTNPDGPPPPSEWDFVKDTSLEKTAQPRVVLDENGKPETASYTYIDNHPDSWASTEKVPPSPRPFSIDQLSKLSGSTDQNELMSLQLNSDKLKTLIIEKVGDKDDLEKINYYLENPAGAIHDLVDAPQKFKERAEKGELLPEQILGANEHKYDELLTRLAILEQNYPSLKKRSTSAIPDVPRDVDREWILTKHYLELLAEPVNDSNSQVVKKYELTDSGEVIKDGRGSNMDTITTALETYAKRNKSFIDESISIPERANPYKGTVEWLSQIDAVDSLDSLDTIEKDFKDILSPDNTQYGLRAKYILGNKVNDGIKEKRAELELKDATNNRNILIEKYKNHPNNLAGINPLNAQVAYSRSKQELKATTKNLESAQKNLQKLQKDFDGISSFRKFSRNARTLRQQIESQQKIIETLTKDQAQAQEHFNLALDRMQFLKTNAKIAKLTQP